MRSEAIETIDTCLGVKVPFFGNEIKTVYAGKTVNLGGGNYSITVPRVSFPVTLETESKFIRVTAEDLGLGAHSPTLERYFGTGVGVTYPVTLSPTKINSKKVQLAE